MIEAAVFARPFVEWGYIQGFICKMQVEKAILPRLDDAFYSRELSDLRFKALCH